MDVLKLRYLIREAIEDTIKQQTVFSMGDKVTTVDGDTATVTMVEHPFYTVELESTGTTKSFQFKDLAPFVEKEVEPQQEGFLLKENVNVSPGLEFHHKNKLNLLECVYRIGSEAYINFYAEAKKLLKEGKIEVNTLDREVLKTDIGEYGIFEGEKVPLDLPMIDEASYTRKGGNGPHYKWKVTLKNGKNKTVNAQSKSKVKDFLTTSELIIGIKSIEKVGDEIVKPALRENLEENYEYKGRTYSHEDLARLDLIAFDKFGRDEEGNFLQPLSLRKNFKQLPDDQKDQVLKLKHKVGVNEAAKKKKTKKDPPLGKPKRGGSKAYYVYVRDPKTKRIKKVSFGSGGLRAKINNPKARQAFAKRHRCSEKNDRTKPSYWSCRLPRYAKALGLGANKNTFW